jgi:hypothetical protein
VLCVVAVALLLPVAAVAGYVPPKRAFNAADQAVARAVTLRARDLPLAGVGWRTEKLTLAGDASVAAAYSTASCAGLNFDGSRITVTGEANSPAFSSAQTFVLSNAAVLASVGQARRYFGGQVGRSALRCFGDVLAKSMNEGLRAQGVEARAEVVAAKMLAVHAAADQVVGLRLTARLEAAQMSVPLVIDVIALRRDRIVATFATVQALGAPNAKLEQKLVAALAARMRT